MTLPPAVRDWLLDSDPGLQWQVERDLLGAPESTWRATRARVPTEGWGATILAAQDADGQWDGGAYFPAGYFGSPEQNSPGQPWTATTWSLKDLRDLGVDADVLGDTAAKLAANCLWEFDDLPYWSGEVDVCINAFTLASGGWLGADVSGLVDWFPEHRLADGGWNCEAEEGESTRSSVHSTLNALIGMLAYRGFTGDSSLDGVRRDGAEYLLSRRLMYRASTGGLIDADITTFRAPNRYRYSTLAALDYFREASLVDGTPPDHRLSDAIATVRAARQEDGRWLQGDVLPGRRRIDLDTLTPGEPSRWLTLIGTRVLDWWDAAVP